MDADDVLRDRFRGTRLCSECVEELDLRHYIAGAEGEPGCSFCDGDDASTCEFIGLMEHVRACIAEEYDLAANCLPWESGEGGWQSGPVWDTYDLIVDHLEIGFARDGDGALVRAMVACLGDTDWCVRNPFSDDPLHTLRLRWQQFCELIKHRTRFFLDRWTPPSSQESVVTRPLPTPATMLSAIGDRIERMELFQSLPAGRTVYRARHFEGDGFLRTPQELGPPPAERAVVANRMSPPGIVMLYAALDCETALLETANGRGRFAVGEFRLLRELWLLDLTSLPEVPGFFASIPDSQAWARHDARFFSELVRDLTRPIDRDNRLHIEYIPTQVVTEYCRLAFHHERHTDPLDGIVYPSARGSGRPALVLFADSSAVAGVEPLQGRRTDPAWFELVDVQYFEGGDSARFSALEAPPKVACRRRDGP